MPELLIEDRAVSSRETGTRWMARIVADIRAHWCISGVPHPIEEEVRERHRNRMIVCLLLSCVVLLFGIPFARAASFEMRISTSADDAEENATTNDVSLDSTDLELIYDPGATARQHVGVRFTQIPIPQGAAVTRAYIQFTVDETSGGTGTLAIRGQAIDNAPLFTNATSNISSRVLTTTSVTWSPSAWNVVGQSGAAQRTSDLKGIIQEIVNRPGWAINNAMAFVITGPSNFRRVAEAYDGSPSQAPLLYVEYSTTFATLEKRVVASADDAEENLATRSVILNSSDLELINDSGADQKVGIRFRAIGLTNAAVVTRAYIQFTADEASAGTVTLAIRGQASDNAPAFTTALGNISSRPLTAASECQKK